jgi:nucleotide-binding universal stress UspA family protein
MPKVIAAVNGSAADRPVLSTAKELGALVGGASVEAIHIKQGTGKGASAAAEAAGVPLRVVAAPIAASLVRASREEGVVGLVVGVRGTPFGPRPAGQTALAVAADSGCPVVAVPPDSPSPFRLQRVLVPMEAGARTPSIVQKTLHRAAAAGLHVVVLHVLEAASLPMFTDQPHYERQAWVQEFRMRYCPEAAEVSVAVRAGSPPDEILSAVAELEVDMVVLAWSQRLVPGHASLVRSVLERASVPVLLLRVIGE